MHRESWIRNVFKIPEHALKPLSGQVPSCNEPAFGRALLPQGRVRAMGIRRPESLFGQTTGRGVPRPIYHYILVGCSAMTRSMFS
ncbi:MAG: hypothetical protein ACFHW5_08890 [Verrucomicrobiota bacterium]